MHGSALAERGVGFVLTDSQFSMEYVPYSILNRARWFINKLMNLILYPNQFESAYINLLMYAHAQEIMELVPLF